LNIVDSDFFDCIVENPIEISVTVGQLPEDMLSLDKFGEYLRGWNAATGIIDEPDAQHEPVITIGLRVDKTLEPIWQILNDRLVGPVLISAANREQLGMTRLGVYGDKHLSWGKGSILAHLTGDVETLSPILANSIRVARQALRDQGIAELNHAAEQVEELAKAFGVKARTKFQAGLDSRLQIDRQSNMTLYDGEVPLRSSGLGSKRLITMAMQRNGVKEGAIILVDEVEAGLEPHRLRQVLRLLRPEHESAPQVFMTTHSSVSIVELQAAELNLVRSNNGSIDIKPVSSDLQDVIRGNPEAFLGKKLVVCEGKTEIGLCRYLDSVWQKANEGLSFGYIGAVLVNGNGTSTPNIALKLRKLGFDVLVLLDSDVPANPSIQDLATANICVIQWADNKAIENCIMADIPLGFLEQIVQFAITITKSRESVLDSIGSRLGLASGAFQGDIGDAIQQFSEERVRDAVGTAAKQKEWFKRIDRGESLGQIIYPSFGDIHDSDLVMKLNKLKDWIYA